MIWFLTQHQALAHQQHVFLTSQLPAYSFRLITGSDNAEYWGSKDVWNAALRSKNGVVSTAQILLDALSHDYVSLDAISLLIFDEAHHCVGNTPYNKIMQLQKRRLQNGEIMNLPQILGLTATPIIRDDLRLVDVVESNLSAICSSPVSNAEEYRGFVHLPQFIPLPYLDRDGEGSVLLPLLERAIRNYRIAEDPTVIRLRQSATPHDQQKLKKILQHWDPPVIHQLRDLLKKAHYLEEDLGPWAADRYINSCARKLVTSVEQQQACLFTVQPEETLVLARLLVPIAGSHVPLVIQPQQITPKVMMLMHYLEAKTDTDTICVVFVQRRTVAYALQDIISTLVEPGKLKSFTFVGCANPLNRNLADLADLAVQQEAFADFKRGERQLCIATQVLEEGIDVQACNLVICYDPPLTAKSYIQRRGRARHPHGTFVLMHPQNVAETKHDRWIALEEEMKRIYARENIRVMEEQKRQAVEVDDTDLGRIVGSTGAEVDVYSARQHLDHFCQTMQRGNLQSNQPLYLVEKLGESEYTCKIILGAALPSQAREACSVSAWPSETAAKKDAALQAYRQIHEAGLLNDHLLPIHKESRQKAKYDCAIETRDSFQEVGPVLDVWNVSRNLLEQKEPLYTCRISIPRLPAMLVLLPFRLERVVRVRLHAVTREEVIATVQPLDIATESAHLIAADATKFLYRSVLLRKLPQLEGYSLPFYLVPDSADHDWTSWLDEARTLVPLKDFSPSTLKEVLLYTRGESMPYFHTPPTSTLGYTGGGEIEAIRLHRTIEFSNQHPSAGSVPANRVLQVDDVSVSGLAPGYVRVVAYMPTIMHFVQVALRAQEALTTVLRSIDFGSDTLVCDAFVSPAAGTANYQRLEYLGDVVLKLMATINVFCDHPTYTEGALSVAMDRLVNNARLQRSAVQLGLDKFLTTESFSGQSWTLGPTKTLPRRLSTKTLADLIEGLLGLAYQGQAFTKFGEVVKCLSLFLPEASWMLPEQAVRDYPVDQLPATISAAYFEDVQDLLGYRFNRPVLLAEALNHSSPDTTFRSYDRLEFLGDAVIDLIVKEMLFRSPHNLDEHQMTLARHALVSAEMLAFLATRMRATVRELNPSVDPLSRRTTISEHSTFKHLHDYLSRLPSLELASQRQQLLDHYNEVENRVVEALTSGQDWPWADLLRLDSPKWTSDVFESIVGAVFIDCGADLITCREVLNRMGLVSLVERAVNDPGLQFMQKRAVLRKMRPGKVKYEAQKYHPDDDEKSWVWKCTAFVDGEAVATVMGCTCEAEAEERAAMQALTQLSVLADNPAVDETGHGKKRRRDSDASVEVETGHLSGSGLVDPSAEGYAESKGFNNEDLPMQD